MTPADPTRHPSRRGLGARRLGLAALISVMAVSGSASATVYPPAVSPAPAVRHTLGGDASSRLSAVTIADVTGDRRPDVLVSDAGAGEVVVLLTGRGGRLGPARRFAATAGVSSIAAGDLDRDGNADLVVGPEIAVLRGDGSGGFGAPVRVTSPRGAFALADVNTDGFPDVVVLETGGLRSLFGDGTGALSAGVCCTAVPPGLTDIGFGFGVGRLDAGAFPDVAFAGEEAETFGGVAILMFGDGAGRFTGGTRAAGTRRAYASLIRDFNRDALLDVAIHDGGYERIDVFTGNGLGGLRSRGGAQAPDTRAFEVADVNGDRRVDVVEARGPGLAVALAAARGGFDFPVPFGTPAGDRPAVADLNLDGRADVLLMNTRARTLSVVGSLRPAVRATCRRASPPNRRSVRCLVWRSPAARGAAVTLRLVGPMTVPGTRRVTIVIPGGRNASTFRASRPIAAGTYTLTATVTTPAGRRSVGQSIALPEPPRVARPAGAQ